MINFKKAGGACIGVRRDRAGIAELRAGRRRPHQPTTRAGHSRVQPQGRPLSAVPLGQPRDLYVSGLHGRTWPAGMNSAHRLRPILQRRELSVPAFAGTNGKNHRGLVISVLEAQSRRRSDVVVHEKAVRQSAIELRAHEADVNIPLRCKLPVDDAGDRVQRTGALRVLFAVAGHDAGGRAEVGMLLVTVISGDHIHLGGNGVFDAGPIDVENPVSKTAGTERCIVDIRVVECLTSQANEVSRDIGESHLRIAGRRISNLFEARIQLQGSIRVSGQHHHGSIVGDRRREHVRQKRWYRVSIGVSAPAQNRGRYGIFHVAINRVEREHAVGEVRDIAAHPELVGAIGGVVLP